MLELGDTSRAEALVLEGVLAGFQKTLGPDHPDTLSAMINIASTYLTEQRFAEAEPAFKAFLEPARRVLGPDHPETLKGMVNLAYVEAALGKNREAETLYGEVLERRRRVLGPEAIPTLSVTNDLASSSHSRWHPVCCCSLPCGRVAQPRPTTVRRSVSARGWGRPS